MYNIYYPYIIGAIAAFTYWLLSMEIINSFFKRYIPEKFSRITALSMIIFIIVFIITIILQYIDISF